MGLETNGFTCVYGSDSNKNAAKVYETNFGDNILSDVTEIKPNNLPDFDVLTGGFPCQPFSAAGKQLGFEDTRGTLFFDICRIVEQKQPTVVLLENVKSLTTHDKGKTFNTIKESLHNLGYTVSHKILNATDFGVPQSRERIIIVAVRGAQTFNFEEIETQPKKTIADILEREHPENFMWLPEEEYVLLDETLTKIQPRSGLKFVGYRKGNLRTNGVRENTQHLSRSHKQFNRIYSDQGTHPTLSAQETSGRYYIHTTKPDGTCGVRKLTITECYRMFGYPDSYKKVGSVSDQYHRIGNSICVPMVTAVGKAISNQIFTPQGT